MAFPDGWTKYQGVTVDTGKITGTLSDFVGVITALDSAIFTASRADGGDVRISTDTAGANQLARHIVSWDKSGETCEVWVNVSSIAVGTTIYVWVGNSTATEPAAGDTYGQYATYPSARKLVSHNGGGTDSTSYGNDGTGAGGISPGDATGKIGDATTFDGTGDSFDLGDSSELTAALSNLTVAVWAKLSATPAYGCIIERERWNDADGFALYTVGSAFWWGKFVDYLASSSITTGVWYRVVGTKAGTSYKLYVNGGSPADAGTAADITAAPAGPDIGIRPGGSSNRYVGILDEVILAAEEWSEAYVGAEYNNQSAPASFWSLGSVVDVAGGSFTNYYYEKLLSGGCG